jgi:hypothetical protein
MANMTYTWKLTGLKKRDTGTLEGVVYQTYWKKTGTDENGNTGEFSGATPFNPATVNPNDFTPYNELTEEIVLGWIQSVVVGSYEEHVNGQIAKQIYDKTHPSQEVNDGGFPWNPPTPTPSATPSAPETTPVIPPAPTPTISV